MCTSQGRDNVMIYTHVLLVNCLFSWAFQQQSKCLRVEIMTQITLNWFDFEAGFNRKSKALETDLASNFSYVTYQLCGFGQGI